MEDKYLTPEQSICAARVFLNTFGLTLEECEDYDEYSKIKIFNSNNQKVGELFFNNGQVLMNAHSNLGLLNASYDIPQVTGFIDYEDHNALFAEWKTDIKYEIKQSEKVKMDGSFLLNCAMDSEFGINCNCHPLLRINFDDKGTVTLKMLRDGSTFKLEIVAGDNYEVIDVSPWDWLNGFLLHDIRNGKYDEEKHAYPYRRYAGIFNGAERGENKDKLHLFLSEEEYEEQLNFHNELIPKVGDENGKEASIQKGMLMQRLDPDMYKRINELGKGLLRDDVSLLDNFISVCYDSYTDEEIKALLGLNRVRMQYQDNADSLINSYFGIGRKKLFFISRITKEINKIINKTLLHWRNGVLFVTSL